MKTRVASSQIQTIPNDCPSVPPIALDVVNLSTPDEIPSISTRRLVVLLPAGEIEAFALAHRIWQLASPSGLDVLYLALVPEPAQGAYQHRRLVELAALTNYPPVRTEIGMHFGKSWSPALMQTLQSGDLLVCLAADYTHGIFRRKVAGDQLSENLGVPVYLLVSLKVQPSRSLQYRIKNVVGWTASLVLIAAFFWLQVMIERSLARPQAITLLCLSVLAELFSMWKINNWLDQVP